MEGGSARAPRSTDPPPPSQVRLVDGAKGAVRPFHLHRGRVRGLAVLDPFTFVSASDDGTARRVDVRAPGGASLSTSPGGGSQQPPIVADLRGGGAPGGVGARAAALAADARRPWLIAVAGSDPVVRVYDVRFTGPGRAPVAAFAPAHATAPAAARAAATARGGGVTGVAFADGGASLLASYAGDAIYEFDVVADAWGEEPGRGSRAPPRRPPSAAAPSPPPPPEAPPSASDASDSPSTSSGGVARRTRGAAPARRARKRTRAGAAAAAEPPLDEVMDETTGGVPAPPAVARGPRPSALPPARRAAPRSEPPPPRRRHRAAPAPDSMQAALFDPRAARRPASSSDEEGDAEVGAAPRFRARFAGHRPLGAARGLALAGGRDEFVVAPSDCGRVFVWARQGRGGRGGAPPRSGRLVAMLAPPATPTPANGERAAPPPASVAVAPHPGAPVLATTAAGGLLRLWAPTADERSTLTGADAVARTTAAATVARGGGGGGGRDDGPGAWLSVAAAAADAALAGRAGGAAIAPVRCAIM